MGSYLRKNYFGFIDDEDFEEKVFYDETEKKAIHIFQ